MSILKKMVWCVLAAGAVPLRAQISSFPYTENFDTVTAPAIPSPWTASGFVTYASSPHSSPNCISSTGNKSLTTLTSPVFDFTDAIPDKLTFYERRTSSAVLFRVQVCVSTDGINFSAVLAEFDTIKSASSYVARVIDLTNAGLQNKSVQFRWQVLADSTNNTGVLRIDDITLTTAVTNDLALSHIAISPALPHRNDSVQLAVTVKNIAVSPAGNYSINFFLDGNNNSIAESGEEFMSAARNMLSSNDSDVVTATHTPLRPGAYRFMAVVSFQQDKNSLNDTISTIINVGAAKGDVLVNEIMYAPSGDEPEWVELFNATNDTIDLKNWKISDNNVSTKSTITSTDYFLSPNHYIVIAKSADFSSLHPNMPVMIASFAALNNTTNDDVVLYDATGTTIDSVQYAQGWGGQNGISLERIDGQASSTSATNWGSSRSMHGSTPDSMNSIARLDVDAALIRLAQTTMQKENHVLPVLDATIQNAGRKSIDTLTITFSCGTKTIWDSTIVHHLFPGDSLCIEKNLTTNVSCTMLVTICCSGDGRKMNDTGSIAVAAHYQVHSIVVNEIMYDPSTGMPEWVEFVNATEDTINFYHWKITDYTSIATIPVNFYILPKKIFVVCPDSAFVYNLESIHKVIAINAPLPSLNNTGDKIVLFDPAGITMDSVQYLPSWGGQNGKSLERIDVQAASTLAANWGTSQDSCGNTAGKINSIVRLDYDASLIRVTQTQIIESGKPVPCIFTTIQNVGRKAIDTITIGLFVNNSHTAFWDSMMVQHLAPFDSIEIRQSLPTVNSGMTTVMIKIQSPNDTRIENDTASILIHREYEPHALLINEIMYAPIGDEPEWVELYNASTETINLKGWKISDNNVTTKSIITSTDYFLPPSKYVVVAKSMDFTSIHPNIPYIVANFSALNNTTADAVVAYDQSGTTMDSVQYLPSWGGQNGKSMERIDVQAASMLAANWGTSQDSSGSTPGKINSIARLEYDAMLVRVTQTSSVENGKTIPVVSTTIRNAGKMVIDTLVLCFYADSMHHTLSDSSSLLCSETILQHLAPLDSLTVTTSLPQISCGNTKLLLKLFCHGDERKNNDTASVTINVEYETHALVINEIMYDPLEGQNEWFELYHAGSVPVDLFNWNFCDRPTSSGSVSHFVISDSSFILLPQHYMVVAADSTILTLFPDLKNISDGNLLLILHHSSGFSFNSDGDAIQLKDLTGKVIDSVAYSPAWHNPAVVDTKGRSLERINPLLGSNDPRNWSTCTNSFGGTPGKPNSILTNASPSGSALLSLSPNPFSPDGDGVEDFCMVSYQVPMSSAFVNIRLYDIKGRLIRTLANTEFGGSNGSFIWNGLDDKGQRVRIGVYIVFFEASDPNSHQSISAKKVVVVATTL